MIRIVMRVESKGVDTYMALNEDGHIVGKTHSVRFDAAEAERERVRQLLRNKAEEILERKVSER